jgi:hypothetical protein
MRILVLVFIGMTSAFLAESCQGDRTQGQQSVLKIAISTLYSVWHDIYVATETGGQMRVVMCYSVRLRKIDRERARDLRRDAQTRERGGSAVFHKNAAFSECSWSVERLQEAAPEQLLTDKRASRYLAINWRIYCTNKTSRNTRGRRRPLHMFQLISCEDNFLVRAVPFTASVLGCGFTNDPGLKAKKLMYTCRKISPSFVDRFKYTRWWPANRGTGREGKW